jgi:hypothetical protein
VEERLTFGGVDKDRVGLAGQFHVRGKSRSSSSNHTRFGDVLNGNLCHHDLEKTFRWLPQYSS